MIRILLLLFLLPLSVEAQTRFYFPTTGSAAVTPTYDIAWDDTTQAGGAIRMVTVRSNSTSNAPTRSGIGATGNGLVRAYVSDPIAAQTITGTVKGQFISDEGASGDNLCGQMVIKVIKPDLTDRGTLLAADNAALATCEFNLTPRNAKHPRNWTGAGKTLTSVTAVDGDRIVVEIGWRQESTLSAARTPIRFGDNSATDLPEDETTTDTTLNPWLEFSQAITFQTGGVSRPPRRPIVFQ